MALKILSPDIIHKSDVSGVSLNLETPEVVRDNAGAMLARIRELRPDARLEGFTVQPMVRRPHALELIVGMVDDSHFGPVILFGHGGIAVEVIGDKALALPPLNMHLAHEVMSQTRVYSLLQGYRGTPAADLESIALTLVKVSQLICDLAEIAELDINPLLADEQGVMALDARIRVVRAERPAMDRLAILPYPKELEETLVLPDGRKLLIRPIRPEDEPNFQKIFASLTPEEIRLRFLHLMNVLSHDQAARLTQIDYDREMALVVEGRDQAGEAELYGGVRISADPDKERAEYAILLRHDMTGLGLGPMLLRRIINYARGSGNRRDLRRGAERQQVHAQALSGLRFHRQIGTGGPRGHVCLPQTLRGRRPAVCLARKIRARSGPISPDRRGSRSGSPGSGSRFPESSCEMPPGAAP